ncbi:NAD-dependent epimerase/dehydratase family protein [Streptomyces sp. NPDC040724]|uniref:SDR family oxidoreductase n=1 Tax=unclassified Streptomyces TaxID=2593676 RepID=UPI0033EDF9C0
MTILVTGATGTLGSHVVERLRQSGQMVRALTRTPAETTGLPDDVEVVGGDLTKPQTLAARAGTSRA